MTIGDVIDNLKQINCKQEEFENRVVNTFRDRVGEDVTLMKNGKDYFFDKRFDIDYQVAFNKEAEPAIKMKVQKDDDKNIVKVLDAWV